jgi:hypothetical protein
MRWRSGESKLEVSSGKNLARSPFKPKCQAWYYTPVIQLCGRHRWRIEVQRWPRAKNMRLSEK